MITGIVAAVAFSPPQFVALEQTFGDGPACWIDLDNDGWEDLCAGGSAWRNEQGKTFGRIADVGSVVAADFDNDGYADLFSYSAQKLYRNEAGKTFKEVSLPTLPASVSRGACWADLDNDGHVDLYVGGFEDWDKNITYPSFVLMNEKGCSFRLTGSDATYRTRGVTACDFDRDGDQDVYVSNYRLQPNRLMVNDGKGQLSDRAAEWNAVATSPGFPGGHSIGACWGDFDNDGRFDLFAGNFAHVDDRGDQPKSRFLRNDGASFADLGTCGVHYQESYASPASGDYDNDGDLDLYFTTVYAVASFEKPNYPVLFEHLGSFKFQDSTADTGLERLPPTSQAAWCDFNKDGKLDLATAGRVFVNQLSSGHWLAVNLVGDGHRVNRSAAGAVVRIKSNGKILTRQVEAGTGEGNQNGATLHFGLGDSGGKVNLEVVWPGGRRRTVSGVRPDRHVKLVFKG